MLLVRFNLILLLFVGIWGCDRGKKLVRSAPHPEMVSSTQDTLTGKGEERRLPPVFKVLPANRISPYDPIIKKYSRRFGFDWRLIAAQIFAESHFRINARSRVGAIGLMQILPSTARHMGLDPKLLVKPEHNIGIGCLYDRRLYNRWKDKQGRNRLAFTFASYNAGRRKVLQAAGRSRFPHLWEKVSLHLPRETRIYVKKIFDRYELYKRKYF